MITIYLFSFPNGKHYVGRTKNSFEQRCTEHKYNVDKKTQHPLYYALNKYGWDDVEKRVLEEVHTHEQAVLRELDYIIHYDSLINGYNLTYNTQIGGDNWEGRRDTEEYNQFVKKMSSISYGENNSMFGKNHSEQTIRLQKEKAKGRYTLEWFKERYGDIEGVEKYNYRCSNRKGQRVGELNTSYKKINQQSFKEDILGGMSKKDLCVKYGLASTSFTGRLKDVFGETSLYRIRGSIK
jgi:group I intron endonuclease